MLFKVSIHRLLLFGTVTLEIQKSTCLCSFIHCSSCKLNHIFLFHIKKFLDNQIVNMLNQKKVHQFSPIQQWKIYVYTQFVFHFIFQIDNLLFLFSLLKIIINIKDSQILS